MADDSFTESDIAREFDGYTRHHRSTLGYHALRGFMIAKLEEREEICDEVRAWCAPPVPAVWLRRSVLDPEYGRVGRASVRRPYEIDCAQSAFRCPGRT